MLGCLAGGDMVTIAGDCSGPGRWKQVCGFLCNGEMSTMQQTRESRVTRGYQGEQRDGGV